MVALYITSTESSGKTALCAALGRKLIQRGAKVGYMIPVKVVESDKDEGCPDADFIKDVLKLTEANEAVCPIKLSREELSKRLTTGSDKLSQDIKSEYQKIARGKDIVLMEGLGNVSTKVSTSACYTVADTVGADVIVVLNYPVSSDLPHVVQMSKKVKLIGVVANLLPQSKIEKVKQQITDVLDKGGIKLLGAVPEIRGALGVTVLELAQVLGGEILSSPDRSGEIIENVMVGAMTVDSGLTYFNRKENKAVVIRSERSDMQLAALQTPLKCLILTNGGKPLPAIVLQAQEKQVPIVSVKLDTASAIAGIEKALAETSFRNTRKLEMFERVLDSCFDFEALYSRLGLKL